MQAPVFSNIDITLGDVTGRLKCSATGDPAPTLFWIQPNGRTTKYSASTASVAPAGLVGLGSAMVAALPGVVEDGARRTDGVLMLGDRTSTPLTGMYICVANNEAGNVTLAVNISWPSPPSAMSGTRQLPRPTVQSFPADADDLLLGLSLDEVAGFPVNFNLTEEKTSKLDTAEERGAARLFSVTELVCAVVVTHVATLLIVVALVAVFVHRRAVRRRRQQQLLPPVQTTAPPVPTSDPDPRLLRGAADPHQVGVSSMYRHNGFQLPGMTGRSTPYANDCLFESGTMRSGFSYTTSNRR